MFTPFSYIKQPVSGNAPPPPPSPVTWKYRYIGNGGGDTRTKTVSNLSFDFRDITYTRSNLNFVSSVNNTETITTDNNTGDGQFNVSRNICRGTGGTGNPKLDEYRVKVFINGSQIYQEITGLANPDVPTCPTQDSRIEPTTSFTVNAGDEVIIEWTDNLTV